MTGLPRARKPRCCLTQWRRASRSWRHFHPAESARNCGIVDCAPTMARDQSDQGVQGRTAVFLHEVAENSLTLSVKDAAPGWRERLSKIASPLGPPSGLPNEAPSHLRPIAHRQSRRTAEAKAPQGASVSDRANRLRYEPLDSSASAGSRQALARRRGARRAQRTCPRGRGEGACRGDSERGPLPFHRSFERVSCPRASEPGQSKGCPSLPATPAT